MRRDIAIASLSGSSGLGCAARKRQEVERVMGIEPTSSAWEAEALPLSYTRLLQAPLSSLTPVSQASCVRMRAMIEITVNGERQTMAPGATAADLLDALSMTGRRIAVEVNEELLPRSRFEAYRRQPGDRI